MNAAFSAFSNILVHVSNSRNQDRALEEAAEKHEQEIKQFKQKVKHLMFEHQSHLSDLQVREFYVAIQALKMSELMFSRRISHRANTQKSLP